MFIQSSSIVTLKHILGLISRNVHSTQVVLQVKFNYNFYTSKSWAMTLCVFSNLIEKKLQYNAEHNWRVSHRKCIIYKFADTDIYP